MRDNAVFENLVCKELEEHRQHFDSSSGQEPKDFIEAFLQEKERNRGTHLEDDLFSNHYLVRVIIDLFIAGTDTTANTLRWALIYMSIYPQEQRRLQSQLDEVLGRERLPNMADRQRLPLLEAVIEETNRLCSLTPTGVMHRATRDIEVSLNFEILCPYLKYCFLQIQGFTIPKDCTVFANLRAVHHDATIFSQPDLFRPDRFLAVM